VDLGGAYTLAVDSLQGRLEVTRGRVVLTHGREEVFVAAGAWCPLFVSGAGVPRRTHASGPFLAAVAATDGRACRSDEVMPLLRSAEAADAITLWHLLPRVQGEERRSVAERLQSLVPMPREVAIDRVLALEPAALEAWWNALGTGTLEEWRRAAGGPEQPRGPGASRR
jgi:hypothetical protein